MGYPTVLDCWLVYHGVNLAEATAVEITSYGYMVVTYRDNPTLTAITLQLAPPDFAWR